VPREGHAAFDLPPDRDPVDKLSRRQHKVVAKAVAKAQTRESMHAARTLVQTVGGQQRIIADRR
jgi:hypothetical protein